MTSQVTWLFGMWKVVGSRGVPPPHLLHADETGRLARQAKLFMWGVVFSQLKRWLPLHYVEDGWRKRDGGPGPPLSVQVAQNGSCILVNRNGLFTTSCTQELNFICESHEDRPTNLRELIKPLFKVAYISKPGWLRGCKSSRSLFQQLSCLTSQYSAIVPKAVFREPVADHLLDPISPDLFDDVKISDLATLMVHLGKKRLPMIHGMSSRHWTP